jgi:hypothetical protein
MAAFVHLVASSAKTLLAAVLIFQIGGRDTFQLDIELVDDRLLLRI